MSINSEFVILAFGVLCICWVMSILIKKCPTCDSNKMNVIPICEIERYRTQENGDDISVKS